MAVYFVTGKLGSGKTLAAVDKIRKYLLSGRRVATNLDIFPDKLVSMNNKNCIHRLPDKPRPSDLMDMGTGDNNHWEDNESYDESKFGCLVLDECATWLNARAKKDNERADFIDYLLHSRKYRWDIFFLVQDEKAVDKQILEALCEHLVEVKRLDRVAIPMLSFWLKLLSFGFLKVQLPKIHLALVRYGSGRASMVVDRWFSYGAALYNAYKTGQVFHNDQLYINDDFLDMRASYTLLSAWHLKGRYDKGLKYKIIKFLNSLLNRAVKPTQRARARKEVEQSYLVKSLMNEYKPSIFNLDEYYTFPDTQTEGLPWVFLKQAD